MLDEFAEKHPELFPDGIRNGYGLKEVRRPKKPGVPTRRITVDSVAYAVRPSFAMPYRTAFADDVEKALFPGKVNVPFRALTYVFGRDDMHWYRMEQTLGRNCVVGTAVKSPELIPENLASDEKHSRLKGEKVCVPTTVGGQCILGASVSQDAGENGPGRKGFRRPYPSRWQSRGRISRAIRRHTIFRDATEPAT